MQYFGFIYKYYTPKLFFFEVVDSARRLLRHSKVKVLLTGPKCTWQAPCAHLLQSPAIGQGVADCSQAYITVPLCTPLGGLHGAPAHSPGHSSEPRLERAASNAADPSAFGHCRLGGLFVFYSEANDALNPNPNPN